jgi:ribonucleoside-diphosphate reductase alpha chain
MKLGINPSKAITTVKPSGTVSCLVDAASGIHPRFAPYYIRRVRIDKKDPLYQLMKDQGVPVEDCVLNKGNTAVFSFPMKSPDKALTSADISGFDHLELWAIYRKYWCDHNPSATITYTDDDFLAIGAWVYQYFDEVCGLSFLPKTEHIYEQAPFEAITKEQYDAFPKVEVDWSQLKDYEYEDNTAGSQTLACSGGSCELVDLVET